LTRSDVFCGQCPEVPPSRPTATRSRTRSRLARATSGSRSS
jgi:hypothetical protein